MFEDEHAEKILDGMKPQRKCRSYGITCSHEKHARRMINHLLRKPLCHVKPYKRKIDDKSLKLYQDLLDRKKTEKVGKVANNDSICTCTSLCDIILKPTTSLENLQLSLIWPQRLTFSKVTMSN